MRLNLRQTLQQIITNIIRIVPQPVLRKVIRRDVISVFYHAVSGEPMPHLEQLYPPIKTEQFEQDLLYLSKNFNLISYEQLHESVMAEGSLPPLALHLSFDDGYIECYSIVRPLLLKYKIPCTFFVTTDWIDNRAMFYRNKISLCVTRVESMEEKEQNQYIKNFNDASGMLIGSFEEFSIMVRSLTKKNEETIDLVFDLLGLDVAKTLEETPFYMTRGQIEQLNRDGFTLGSHTRSHEKLVNLKSAVIEEEIVESSNIIQEISGSAVVPFSFPNSAARIDRKLLNDIHSRHPFLGLFFDSKGIKQDLPFMINRIWAEKSEWNQEKITPNRLAPAIRSVYQSEMNSAILSRAKIFKRKVN